jgi:hypothetical protein
MGQLPRAESWAEKGRMEHDRAAPASPQKGLRKTGVKNTSDKGTSCHSISLLLPSSVSANLPIVIIGFIFLDLILTRGAEGYAQGHR